MLRRILPAGAIATFALALAACTPTINLEAAPHANTVECSEANVRIPDAFGDTQRVWTNAQSTAAWGEPTAIIYTCGLDEPAPTTLQCVRMQGVDWIVDPEEDSAYMRITTYGRSPAIQMYIDASAISPDAVLPGMAAAALQLPQTGECVDLQDATPVDEDADLLIPGS
ncbi:DUF3515 family protein [Microbacterium amylolyticum]|uniref:DUF3515 domain-containing protein n=1 Tax=Microbacterium amylolyticum TaxID=936337 RepID=A0ABS4ZEY8_9MICO|nr:DUF3515 family protein [Microbacterium amylolyticum]MBP2435851.1 hypothetical protein [Microbacterium amylolyticum]